MRVYEARLEFDLIENGPVETLNTPDAVAAYMEGAFPDPTVEWFYVILVNRKNRPLGRVPVTKGTATSSLVHPREVFRPAILAGASGIIAVHNHPSGDPSPSSADIQVTRQLREAAKTIGIDLIDHIVIGDRPDSATAGTKGHYSFREAGLL